MNVNEKRPKVSQALLEYLQETFCFSETLRQARTTLQSDQAKYGYVEGVSAVLDTLQFLSKEEAG